MKDVSSTVSGLADDGPAGLSIAAREVARRLKRPSLAPVRLAFLVTLLDLPVYALAFWFAQFAAAEAASFHPLGAALRAICAAALAVATLRLARAYRIERLSDMRAALPRLMGAAVLPGLWLAAGAAGGPVQAFGAVLLATVAVVVPLRLAVAGFTDWALATGVTERRAVLACSGPEAVRLIHGLAGRPHNDIRIHAMFDERGTDRVPDRILDVPLIGDFDALVQFCRETEIDLILVTLPPTAADRIAWLLDRLRVLPLPVHLTAFSKDLSFRDDGALDQLIPPSFRPEQRLAKRLFDLTIGTAMLVGLAPLMLLIAMAIRLDSRGSVFFTQLRHGFNNRPVRVWKFRTLYADQCDAAASRIVTRGDRRVTRVGGFLRRTSLDELPQLFNVLNGSLSLVGPRPHALNARSSQQVRFETIVDGYSARHRLPPGITGWAQIHGYRGEVSDPDSLRARFDHDLHYIANWSVWLDLRILLRTPASLVTTSKAY